MPKCPETIEELDRLERLLPLCRKRLYDLAQAKLESGAARTQREASRQIAEELGRPEITVRQAIRREEQSHNLDTLYPPCETPSQDEEEKVYPLPPSCPISTPAPHVSFNAGNNEWYTPPEFLEAAREVMGCIDLDPASSPIANETVKAEVFYSAEDNGLDKSWAGKIWLNPPYAGELIGKFCEKLCQHFEADEVLEAIVLVNNATETYWFNRLISFASAVCFPRGRVRFLDPDGNPKGAPLQGQAVVYIGGNSQSFIENFNKFGWTATIWKK